MGAEVRVPCRLARDGNQSRAAFEGNSAPGGCGGSLVPRPSYTAADGLHHRYVKRGFGVTLYPSSRNVGTPIRFEACNNCIPQLLFKVIRNR